MASSFAALRAQQGNALDKIKQKVESSKGGSLKDPTLDDPTYWNPQHVRGKDGTGEAIIRFLPACDGEDDAFVKYTEFAFEGPGGWYINKSRMSLGSTERDPVFAYNGEIFKDKSLSKEERNKRLLGRREHYTANILVISDPNKPENEGKVLKWKFGAQVFNIVNGAMFPEFASVKAINPFDPVEGANFHFRVYTKKIPNPRTGENTAVPSYEKSGFAAPSEMFEDLADFDKIWHQQHKLAGIVAEDQFKSYDDLKREFDRAMGLEKKSFLDTDEPLQKAEPKEKPVAKAKEVKKTLAEEIDDEIPFVSDDESETKASEFASDGDDDWFNTLKK